MRRQTAYSLATVTAYRELALADRTRLFLFIRTLSALLSLSTLACLCAQGCGAQGCCGCGLSALHPCGSNRAPEFETLLVQGNDVARPSLPC
jgi:hypothetical protein